LRVLVVLLIVLVQVGTLVLLLPFWKRTIILALVELPVPITVVLSIEMVVVVVVLPKLALVVVVITLVTLIVLLLCSIDHILR